MFRATSLILISFGLWAHAGQVTTQGTGEISLVPDQVHFLIVIRVDNDQAGRALGEADSQSKAVIDGFRELGVIDDQMKTLSLNVYQAHDYRDGEVIRTYYVAEHRLRITLDNLALIGQGFDIVAQQEGQLQASIQLDSSQRKLAMDQALAEAIRDARRKATIMAEAEGMQLGAISQMTNTRLLNPGSSFDDRSVGFEGSTTVMPGQITISTTATVVYDLELIDTTGVP